MKAKAKQAVVEFAVLQESDGIFNRGWFGGKPLTDKERFHPYSDDAEQHASADQRFGQGTQEILDRYFLSCASERSVILDLVDRAMVDQALARIEPRKIFPSADKPSYSIITPFFRHKEFFGKCAQSVDTLIGGDLAETGVARIEWIVVNDDPSFSASDLEALVPVSCRPFLKIVSDGQNKGISARLNDAVAHADNEWVLYLDCDDEIISHATKVLDHYIKIFPVTRYISSGMIDIDEESAILRYRRHELPVERMFHSGMLAGHLKAVRKDLLEEVGGHSLGFSGCQDYDIALQTLIGESLLLVPEYLYRYRWHGKSQSVGASTRQDMIAERVRRKFLYDLARCAYPESCVEGSDAPVIERGLCIIRTQGRNLDLLDETLASVLAQQILMIPCVVVHGDEQLYNTILSWVSRSSPEAIVLHAHDRGRRRGYPLNVALDYLRENAGNFGFFAFLDDDDILYPGYANKLVGALVGNGADVAFGLSTKRTPWQAPERGPDALPIPALVAGNFIPIHCYIVRTDFLVRSGVRAREDMHYLEDWDFLVAMLAAGARYSFISDYVCEFRIIGDGNRVVKQDPEHYDDCRDRVFVRGSVTAASLGFGFYLRELARFPFDARAKLEPGEIGHLLDMKYVFNQSEV